MEASQSKNILEYLENLRPKIDRKIEEYLPRKVSTKNGWKKFLEEEIIL